MNVANNIGTRAFGIDLVRAFAIFAVIGGHFFSLHTPYGSSAMDGGSMMLQSVAQFLFSGGVPLFILLTGYLNSKKIVSKKYYKGIWRVLNAYLFFSVLCLSYKHFYLHETVTLKSAVFDILAYKSFLYGWYIEMWIGLFLIIPFLNLMYGAIASKRDKLLLIGILSFLTFAPTLTNRYGLHILPGYWKDCYPLTFYFIGAFVKEYQVTLRNKWKWVVILLLICSLNGGSSMVLAFGDTPKQLFGHCFGLVGSVMSVITFLLLYDVKCSSAMVERGIYWVSLLSLDMYLCCWMFDATIYPWALKNFYTTQSGFGLWFFVIVPAVFFGSMLMAYCKHLLFAIPVRERTGRLYQRLRFAR